jgi:hypothetical protein
MLAVVVSYSGVSRRLGGAATPPPSNEADLGPTPGYDPTPYTPPKKKRSKWLIVGLPILLIVIIAAVVGGVVGSRKNSSSSSSSGGGGGGGAGTVDGAHSSILHQQGRFAVSTDSYFLPVYPSTVSFLYPESTPPLA